jgi:hypothetical protein
MPRDFVYRSQPDALLGELESDAGRAKSLEAIDEVLASLGDDPGDPKLGTKVWATQVDEQRTARSTPVPELDWYIVWTMATVGADIEIIYIGPENPED